MIIRSQDKKSITTDLNLQIYEDELSNMCEISNGAYITLGAYSTEEKAIKVLDMIQKAYSKANYYFISNGFVQNVIFEMPQDSEV